jgi:adenylate cyclase, class 2
MSHEVEQKFVLADAAGLLARLEFLRFDSTGEYEQRDRYYNHPSRDFGHTDEALRIRSVGEKNFVTYKGPKLSARTKTRYELELPLAPGKAAAEDFAALLVALSFTPVATVEKMRRVFARRWEGRQCEIALDQVRDVGTFAEIEFIADANGFEAVEESLLHLADQLGLVQVERRSYLELLLARRTH